jgi:hypothetical protein
MPNTRDDLSIAYRNCVKSQGGKAALDVLKKALQPKAPIKTLAGLHAHMNNLASDIYEKQNVKR